MTTNDTAAGEFKTTRYWLSLEEGTFIDDPNVFPTLSQLEGSPLGYTFICSQYNLSSKQVAVLEAIFMVSRDRETWGAIILSELICALGNEAGERTSRYLQYADDMGVELPPRSELYNLSRQDVADIIQQLSNLGLIVQVACGPSLCVMLSPMMVSRLVPNEMLEIDADYSEETPTVLHHPSMPSFTPDTDMPVVAMVIDPDADESPAAVIRPAQGSVRIAPLTGDARTGTVIDLGDQPDPRFAPMSDWVS